jgi:diguanylate cyclase (GGDEF)-like protein
MGIGITAMHYTGMFAMRMSPPIVYDPWRFIASVLIAIVASLAALFIAFQLRRQHSITGIVAKLGSAVLMGFAIAGMHYTGMAAAQFAPGSVCLAEGSNTGMDTASLAVIIGVATVSMMLVTLAISALDTHRAVHTARLADALQAANEKLRNIALYDALTGLPNRFLLKDRLEQAVSRAERSVKPFALLFVDLDKFKPVNDSFGHQIGDKLLIAVAERLSGCIRKDDTVARCGGDEFVVVLNQIGQASEAATISAKIVQQLSRYFHIEGHELEISCSIGISVYPADGSNVDILMSNADAAMYRAKRDGRNNFKFFAPGEINTASPNGA